jgi:hypothetical protein
MKTANLGAISIRSKNTTDLICAFSKKLLWFDNEGAYRDLIGEALVFFNDCKEGASTLIDRLIIALNDFAPKYCFFGQNPNAENDYGFWVRDTFDEECNGLMVYDFSEIPAYYTGEIIHLTDAISMTLYSCKDGELTKIWSA